MAFVSDLSLWRLQELGEVDLGLIEQVVHPRIKSHFTLWVGIFIVPSLHKVGFSTFKERPESEAPVLGACVVAIVGITKNDIAAKFHSHLGFVIDFDKITFAQLPELLLSLESDILLVRLGQAQNSNLDLIRRMSASKDEETGYIWNTHVPLQNKFQN